MDTIDKTRDPQLVCLLDVIGFKNLFETLSLDEIYVRYSKLIEYVKKPRDGIDLVPTPDGHVAVGWLAVRSAFFSDTLLFWTRYSKMSLPSFTHSVAEAICFGLEIGLPLRGAIAVGNAILDEKTGMFLGKPLNEAADTERMQQWIGASFGPSFAEPGYTDGFHLNTVLPYKSHYKSRDDKYATGMTVDWPRRWREERNTDPRKILRCLDCDPEFSSYYSCTEAFIDFSDANHDWFHNKDHLDYG